MRKQDYVLELVAKHFGIDKADILSKGRQKEIAMAKHMFIYILREHCGMTLVKICAEMQNGDYHHSSVISAYSRMRDMILSKDRLCHTIYKAILDEMGEDEEGWQINVLPRLIVRYPKGFNIQEVIKLINSKHKNLEYELI